MKVYLAADHAGFGLKEKLKHLLLEKKYEVEDCGATILDIHDDYTTFVAKLGEAVSKHPTDRGIICAGTGEGEAMLANKYKKVRAAVFYGTKVPITSVDAEGRTSTDAFEVVKLTREHNNANVLSIGSRFALEEEVFKAAEIFLTTAFSHEARHKRRVETIERIEEQV